MFEKTKIEYLKKALEYIDADEKEKAKHILQRLEETCNIYINSSIVDDNVEYFWRIHDSVEAEELLDKIVAMLTADE